MSPVVTALFAMIAAGICMGDSDGNKRIEGPDFLAFQQAFHSHIGDDKYDVRFDFNVDGNIDGADYLVLQRVFGRACRAHLTAAASSEWRPRCSALSWEWEAGAQLPEWPASSCVWLPMDTIPIPVPVYPAAIVCDGGRTYLLAGTGECPQ